MHNNVLLTGFRPFKDNQVNPSELVVNNLVSEGYQGLILDVSYKKADIALNPDVLFKNGYSTIVCFGLAAKRDYISMEKFAYNEISSLASDEDGYIPSSLQIQPGGKNLIATSFNLNPALDALVKEGISARISSDPGRYLCNYAYYKSLVATSGSAIFIHLPSIQENWTTHKMTKAAEIILSSLHIS